MPEPTPVPELESPPARRSCDYAVIRVVPRVERGECLNVGVIVFCRTLGFLGARVALDAHRLLTLAPDLDLTETQRQLAQLVRICEGDPAFGPIARMSPSERFNWLVAPRSTVIQTSQVHTALYPDPAAALDHLMATMVTTSGA